MNQVERERVRNVVRKAHRSGHDPYEQLDRCQLILTSIRYHEIRANMLHELALELENAPIGALLKFYGSGGQTAYDAQRVITEWIRTRARKEES